MRIQTITQYLTLIVFKKLRVINVEESLSFKLNDLGVLVRCANTLCCNMNNTTPKG